MCNEIALADFSPLAIAAYRIGLAAVLLLVFCYWFGQRVQLTTERVVLFFAIGLLNSAVPFFLIGWGQIHIDSATTGILLASSPFVTLLLSHYMTHDDRFTWHKLMGLIIGFAGVVLLLANGLMLGSSSFGGMLVVVIAACCYAVSSILIRRLGSVPSLVLAAGSLAAATVCLLPVLLIIDPPWQQELRPSTLTAMIYLAVGPTATCYVLRAQVVKTNGAVFMSTVGYLIPVFAVLWSWLFFKQQPTIVMLAALVFILSGIAIGQRKDSTRN